MTAGDMDVLSEERGLKVSRFMLLPEGVRISGRAAHAQYRAQACLLNILRFTQC